MKNDEACICLTEVLSAIPSSLFYLSTLIMTSSVLVLLLSGANGKQTTLSQFIEMCERMSNKVQSQITLDNGKSIYNGREERFPSW